MSITAIEVTNLSKRYRIGAKEQKYDTLGGTLLSWVKSPVSNFKRIRRLTSFVGDDDPSVLWALKDINFSVEQGSVVGIIGRNGAGKSTLLKILSRITDPTTGEIKIRGRISSLLEVGTGFHQELTGRENVYLNGTILGMSKNEVDRKFDEIVDFSEVERFIDTPVKFYSSGMRVRLAFSVAAHLEPEIFLVDEVLAVGDLNFQQKCLNHMRSLTETGMTILLVSHNMMAIQSSCKEAYLLNEGKIESYGKPLEVIERYRDVLASQTVGGKVHIGSMDANDTSAGVEILAFEMFGADGVPKRQFDFNEPVKIQFTINAKKRIENPYINFGIVRGDNVIITNFSNYYDNFHIEYLEGVCVLTGWLPPLRLVPNYYEIHVVVWPWGGAHQEGDLTRSVPYAHKTFDTFRMTGPGLNSADGVYSVPASKWLFERNGSSEEFTAINDRSVYEALQPASTAHDSILGEQ